MAETKTYELYLNGALYGKGPADYIAELMTEYVVARKMYGRHDVTFSVQEVGNNDGN